MGRKLTLDPGGFPGEGFAPIDGEIRLSREGGANSHSRRGLFRVKGLRPSTEE